MQTWFQFYSLAGGAAATLLGLLFVAVSMNAAAILGAGREQSKRLAEQAFQNYLAVIATALLVLFPGISTSTVGAIVLGVTAASAGWLLIRLYLAFTRPHARGSRSHILRRYISSLIGFGMLIFAAARMALKAGDNQSWLAGAAIVLLLSATVVSWELLIKIAGETPAHSGE